MFKAIKTGIISDLRMLDHKSKKKHPQSPARLQAILDMFQKKQYLSHHQIDYIKTYERLASNEQLGMVYPKKYIEYIDSLWPKASHRTDLTVLDTYFNKNSSMVSRLSCGGVLEGIDNIMNQKWANGFSLIRPPGHHSGAKNTINGFCIYNNIAIGAKYIQQKYNLKRIAIFDYDIHQGDGTHAIFQNDPSVLFISTHRHDRGSFYPIGEGGNYTNCGKQDGEGFSLNIPLNCVDKNHQSYSFQAPGDNEIIYLYKRLIQPVLKEFNPQFILVSSGFDGARYDYLGGCTFTPNGYFYLTKKLLQLNKPLLCVLQGGYNLKSTSQAALSVVKGLLNEEMLPQPVKNLKFQDLQYECHLQVQYLEEFDQMIDFFSKYWKCLNENQLIQYTNKIKNNTHKKFGIVNNDHETSSSSEEEKDKENQKIQEKKEEIKTVNQQKNEKITNIHDQQNKSMAATGQKQKDEESTTQFYFASGHMQRFKDFSLSKDRFLKWMYPQELQFYESDFPEKKFAPQYYGKEEEYAILQNILYNEKDHIVLDIKLSRRSKYPLNTEEKRLKQQKKESISTSEKYAFRIGGFTTPQYKEGGLLISDQDTNKKLLAKVVCKENKQFYCDFLKKMSIQLKTINRHYYGTSILLLKGKQKSSIKWIDFHYWIKDCQTYDNDLIEGIQNLIKFIQEIKIQ